MSFSDISWVYWLSKVFHPCISCKYRYTLTCHSCYIYILYYEWGCCLVCHIVIRLNTREELSDSVQQMTVIDVISIRLLVRFPFPLIEFTFDLFHFLETLTDEWYLTKSNSPTGRNTSFCSDTAWVLYLLIIRSVSCVCLIHFNLGSATMSKYSVGLIVILIEVALW